MSEEIKDGKTRVMGIDIDISEVIGNKIVDQYLAKLTDEDIEKIMDYISDDLFTTRLDGSTEVKTTQKDSWGNCRGNRTIGDITKELFNERIKEELIKKIEEKIQTEDYQKKINDIADEIIDYSVNGYKEDMKQRIRERLIGNLLNAEPAYCGESLITIINSVIDSRIHR